MAIRLSQTVYSPLPIASRKSSTRNLRSATAGTSLFGARMPARSRPDLGAFRGRLAARGCRFVAGFFRGFDLGVRESIIIAAGDSCSPPSLFSSAQLALSFS